MADGGTSSGEGSTDEDQRVERAVARALEMQIPALIARLAGRTASGGVAREEESKCTTIQQFLPPGMTGAIGRSIIF